jgi:hypothetical protein
MPVRAIAQHRSFSLPGFLAGVASSTHPKAFLASGVSFPLPPLLYVIMNSALSLSGAAHSYRRKNSTAEIRAAER